MKVWWVVAWDRQYPESGLYNVKARFEHEEDACSFAVDISDKYDVVEVVNIKHMLF